MVSLDEGKIPWELLKKLISLQGYQNPGVIMGPGIGQDVAILAIEEVVRSAYDYYDCNGPIELVYKTDPITFPTPSPGRYAVIVNSNDVVTAGALPFGFTATIIFPPGENEKTVLSIQKEIHATCVERKISVLGGHSEVSNGVNRPIVVGSMIGFVPKKYRVSRKIKAGDFIVCSGWVGAEGTGIIASEAKSFLKRHLTEKQLDRIQMIGESIDIADRTLKINKKFQPRLIHDATEGGVLGAIYETLSPLGFGAEISRDTFPISEETQKICDLLNIDPLKLISSGCVLFISDLKTCEKIVKDSPDIPTKIIGEVHEKENQLRLDGSIVSDLKGDALVQGLLNLEAMMKDST